MGFSVPGSDRFLQAATGQAVAAVTAANIKTKLHTANPPTAGNELSGNGYSDVVIAASGFTRADSGVNRRMRFPAQEWFADAGSQAQTAEALGFWLDTVLAWSAAVNIVPENARVFANAGDVFIGVEKTDSSFIMTDDMMDRGFRALAGEAVTAVDLFLELHSGAPPSNANRLTGGGINGIPVGAWALTTVAGFRRIAQGALTFTAALTADTTAEPTHIGLWRGRPEASGVLQAYREVSPTAMTQDGASITVPANTFYFEVGLEGA